MNPTAGTRRTSVYTGDAVACGGLTASAVTARSMRSLSSRLSPEHGWSVSPRVPVIAPAAHRRTLADRVFDFLRRNRSLLYRSVVFLGERDAVRVPLHFA